MKIAGGWSPRSDFRTAYRPGSATILPSGFSMAIRARRFRGTQHSARWCAMHSAGMAPRCRWLWLGCSDTDGPQKGPRCGAPLRRSRSSSSRRVSRCCATPMMTASYVSFRFAERSLPLAAPAHCSLMRMDRSGLRPFSTSFFELLDNPRSRTGCATRFSTSTAHCSGRRGRYGRGNHQGSWWFDWRRTASRCYATEHAGLGNQGVSRWPHDRFSKPEGDLLPIAVAVLAQVQWRRAAPDSAPALRSDANNRASRTTLVRVFRTFWLSILFSNLEWRRGWDSHHC